MTRKVTLTFPGTPFSPVDVEFPDDFTDDDIQACVRDAIPEAFAQLARDVMQRYVDGAPGSPPRVGILHARPIVPENIDHA